MHDCMRLEDGMSICTTCNGQGVFEQGTAGLSFIGQCPQCFGSGTIQNIVYNALLCTQCQGSGYSKHNDGVTADRICELCCGHGILDDRPECHETGGRERSVDVGTKPETVHHPQHYNTGKFEVIDVIEDWKLGFNDGNAVKYIARHMHKAKPEEDLRKALWYIARELVIAHNAQPEDLATYIRTIRKSA